MGREVGSYVIRLMNMNRFTNILEMLRHKELEVREHNQTTSLVLNIRDEIFKGEAITVLLVVTSRRFKFPGGFSIKDGP